MSVLFCLLYDKNEPNSNGDIKTEPLTLPEQSNFKASTKHNESRRSGQNKKAVPSQRLGSYDYHYLNWKIDHE